MAIERKKKTCKGCGESKYIWAHGLCQYCDGVKRSKKQAEKVKNMTLNERKQKIKPIPKKSKKQRVIDGKYTSQRIIFLSKPENQICFIDGCNKKANTVEHTKGRGHGYFDEWAEKNDICKTLDERFWKPCCLEHNLELENNPELSKKYQLSKLHDGKKI